jgi:DNA-binding PadR family transcriptional regulator
MTPLTPDETILGLLAAQARHGYQLLECFHDSSQLGTVWYLSTSQVYAVLKRLEQQGLIAGRTVEMSDAPTRTEYCLTEAGENRLHGWLDEVYPSPSIRRIRVEFLSRLFIARLLNIPTLTIVKQQKAACRQRLAELVAERAQTMPGISFLTTELVIAQLSAVLQWIDRCELVPKEEEEA